MNMPGFNAVASLSPPKSRYQVNSVFGRLGSAEVLPMLPRHPTFDNPGICFEGAGEVDCSEGGGLICSCCYEDGCWICENKWGMPYYGTCVWDDKYSKRPTPKWPTGRVSPLSPLSGVFPGMARFQGGRTNEQVL